MGNKAGKIWGTTELVHANGVLEFHRITFKAGYKCSEHQHKFKWNGFYVESGRMNCIGQSLTTTISREELQAQQSMIT